MMMMMMKLEIGMAVCGILGESAQIHHTLVSSFIGYEKS